MLAVAVLVVTVRDASAAEDADQFEPVRQRIAKALVDTNVPSIAVAVARDGKIIWEQGFGWADRENRVPASEHTLYSLASISKPITATGLMVLVEREKIDLDKPINDYLGEAKLQARVGDAAGGHGAPRGQSHLGLAAALSVLLRRRSLSRRPRATKRSAATATW